MADSNYPTPPGTPDPSSSPTPIPERAPEPTTDPDANAERRDLSAATEPRKPTRSRSRKTTRRKSSRSRKKTSSRSTKVDPGEAPKPRASSSKTPAADVDPKVVRKVLEQGGEAAHSFGCQVLGIDPDSSPDLFALTTKELDDLAPPLARIATRHAAAARLVEASDELVVAAVIGKATIRNVIDARWAIEQANAAVAPTVVADREGGDDGRDDETRDVSAIRG